MWQSDIKRASGEFLIKGIEDLKDYQIYKDKLVKIVDQLSPGDLVDFAVTLVKGHVI